MRELKVLKVKAPDSVPSSDSAKESRSFDIELITPLYGGGTVAGVNDSDFPVRPTSVRGQLRFWWRATRGARFNTPKELYEEESKIWGNVEKPSGTDVKIHAPVWKQNRAYIGPRDNNYGFGRFGSEAYVLFPAVADTSRHNLVKEGLIFNVEIAFNKDFEDDVLCAVWAWVNFGGIGARTRRGCGALYCKELAPSQNNPGMLAKWFGEATRKYELRLDERREWPTLSSQILTGVANTNSLVAWAGAIAPMKNFRQGVGIGRNKGSREPNRPGRSFWPEPDTLRRVFGKCNSEHKPSDKMPNGFPRAALGLPVIFHFVGSRGDPDSEMYSKGGKRMGSPIILRPLKTQDNNNAPMTVLLRAPLPEELELKGSVRTFGTAEIVNRSFTAYPNAPMKGRSSNGNAVEAFIAYLKEQNFKEVGR
ncbi:hypothetical protein AGMMS50276_00210 [Synergistales bacterium]|nr:hypothetical protein AGMMS50276_00210 [Synergistales bacterium]